MKRLSFSFLLCCALLKSAVAADQPLDQVLTAQYHGRVMALRHFLKIDTQEYGADGSTIRAGQEGSWTLYGRIAIEKISVDEQQLIVTGKRVPCFFARSGDLVWLPEDRKHRGKPVRITVRLQRPLASADDAQGIIGKVFAQTTADMLDSVPDYWRPYLEKQFGIGAGSKEVAGSAKPETPNLLDFRDKTHFTPPYVFYRPDPVFTEEASRARFQGVVGLNVVIEPTGKVGKITIVRPLGMGLDEMAIDAVRRWRAEPAKRDGEPVAMTVFVEIDFHLYN
jgi:TonB family protein